MAEVRFEIGQIDKLFSTYAELLAKVHTRESDLIELTALGSVLHSFYNGVESIFASIAKQVDSNVPSGAASHRTLLNQMSAA
jgi:hypothetical protein